MRNTICLTPQGCHSLGEVIDGQQGLPAEQTQEFYLFQKEVLAQAAELGLEVEQVYIAWEIARLAEGIETPEDLQALQLIVLAALSAATEGNTRMPLNEGGRLDRILNGITIPIPVRQSVYSLLERVKRDLVQSANGQLFSIIGSPESYVPLIFDHNCLYLQKYHVLEARVGLLLRQMIDGWPGELRLLKKDVDEILNENALREVFSKPPQFDRSRISLDVRQQQAVRLALKGRITVISGRPGSGKTSIVASLLRVIARLGDPPPEAIALAAPTGKAADRMRQSIVSQMGSIPGAVGADLKLATFTPQATTLHRLLGYSPGTGRFWHNEQNPLSEKLIIVDESSMIDLATADQLLRALKPEAQLVLLGDAEQLPPVDAGAVFSDLCRSQRVVEKGRMIILEQIYRAREEETSGKSIINLALAINSGNYRPGQVQAEDPVVRRALNELAFDGVEMVSPGSAEQREAFFELWFNRFCLALPGLDQLVMEDYPQSSSGFDEQTAGKLKILFDHFERYKMLTVTRVTAGGTGSESINLNYHQRWLEKLRLTDRNIALTQFLPGEPVMITHNDYLLRLFNGDSGIILPVVFKVDAGKGKAEPMAVFPRGRGFTAYPLGVLQGRLELAWATTVHKAQGSEYDYVALILPDTQVRPLNRELLYTAVTRARRSVVIIGSDDVLETGIRQSVDRSSGLTAVIDAG